MISPLLFHKERLVKLWEITPQEDTRHELLAAIHEVDNIVAAQVAEDTERQEEFRVLLGLRRV